MGILVGAEASAPTKNRGLMLHRGLPRTSAQQKRGIPHPKAGSRKSSTKRSMRKLYAHKYEPATHKPPISSRTQTSPPAPAEGASGLSGPSKLRPEGPTECPGGLHASPDQQPAAPAVCCQRDPQRPSQGNLQPRESRPRWARRGNTLRRGTTSSSSQSQFGHGQPTSEWRAGQER